MSFFAWIAVSSLASAVVPAATPVEVSCSALVKSEGGPTVAVNDDSLQVLEQTSGDAGFTYGRKNTLAIRCMRNDIVPAVNDYKVVRAGFPLYIVHGSSDDTRIGVLEVSGGQFRFRIVEGELAPAERKRLLARLNEIQEASRPPG